MTRTAALLVAATLACASAPAVRPGVEVFAEHPPARVLGKRVGLITNQSGIDRQRRSTIDLLRGMRKLTLVALYSPEHGIRGVAETRVASTVDEKTGLPIHSLYGDTDKPTPQMYNAEQRIGADLTVVPVDGWRRDMWWDETGLPWVNPSPNIRRLEAAIHYPGTVFFEATNVSEGRGTDLPFEQIGAPWLRNSEVVAAMNAMNLPGIRFEAVEFPTAETARKYPGQVLKGVRLTLTDRASYRPLATSLLMIDVIRRLHPDQFQWAGATLERHGGSARLRQAIEAGTLAELLREWERDQATFRTKRAAYLIYR